MYVVARADRLPVMPDRSPTMNSRRRLAATLVAASAALCLAAAPAAQADSVAYVKDGDVWLSTTDGSRQYRVTEEGGYSTVSQADCGRMVALRGDKIRQLDRDGTVVSEIATPVSTSTDPSMAFQGPFDPEISPNGQKVAYTYYWQYTGYDPYCNPSTGCYTKRLYHGTGFTAPDRLTAWDEPGFARRSGWIDASWVDDEQVLLSDPYIQPNEDTVLWKPGVGESSLERWFQDPAYPGDVSEATISRDKSAMVTITKGGKGISILRSEGRFFPNYPERCFEGFVEDGVENAYSSPTLSADGTRAYWAENDGIHVATLPDFTYDSCGELADGGSMLVAGAKNPSWGPADVPAERPVKAPQEQPGPIAGGPVKGGPTPVVPSQNDKPLTRGVRLAVTAPRLKVALRRGFTVKLTGAKPGRHTLVAKLAGRKVASGKAVVGADGTGKVTLKFTAAARRKLARKRTAVLSITGAGAKLTLRLATARSHRAKRPGGDCAGPLRPLPSRRDRVVRGCA